MLEERIQNLESNIVVFFYCSGNFQETKDPRYIIGSILKQLFSSCALDAESPAYQRLKKLNNSGNRMPISEMTSTIQWLSRFFAKIVIIVDGIDECLDPRALCSALITLVVKNMRVLAISRPERDISTAFSSYPTLEMDEAVNYRDIVVYVREWRMNHDLYLRRIKNDLKEHIKQRLLDNCGGMY
jgi:hypothetical protein